jgi:beta-phosphoglucomutase-like phosphatase (HAD superfamily)
MDCSDDCDSIVADITAQIASFYQNVALAKPGVPVFLETLRGAGVRMCIATATDHARRKPRSVEMGCCTILLYSHQRHRRQRKGPHLPSSTPRWPYWAQNKEATIVFEDALHAVHTAKRAGYRVDALQDDAANRTGNTSGGACGQVLSNL